MKLFTGISRCCLSENFLLVYTTYEGILVIEVVLVSG